MSGEAISAELDLGQARIDAWARVSDDANPLHVDPAYARSSRFGWTIAHGHLLIAFLLEQMLAAVGPDWLRGGELRDARFRAPVLAGTRCRLEATPVDPAPGASATWQIELTDVTTGTVCVTALAVLAVPSTP